MRGRENIVPGTGEQRLYMVYWRADCTRERGYCPRYGGADAVQVVGGSRSCTGIRYKGSVALPRFREQGLYRDI